MEERKALAQTWSSLHTDTHVHLPGYYCLTVSKETGDLSLESVGLTVELKINVKERAGRWRDGGES